MFQEIKSRRRMSRLRGRFPVEFEWNGKNEKGIVINFSEGGLFIQSETLPDPGSILNFQGKLTKEEETTIQGKVVWKRSTSVQSLDPEPKGFGVEITQRPIKFLAFVKRFRKFLETHRRVEEDRIDVAHKVTFRSGPHFISEYCENLSRGGMYLATEEPLEIGKVVSVKLEIPSFEKSVHVEGRVAYRLDAMQANTSGHSPGVGIQFIDLSPEATAHLSHYIKRLEIHRYTPERRRMDNLPTSGSLSDFIVPEILIGLFELESSGVLHLKSRSLTKSVYCKNGQPVYVDSPLKTESLGYHLLRENIISHQDLERTLRGLEEKDLQHGEILVREGLIDPPSLAHHLVKHQEEKLLNTFPWFEGTFEFIPGTQWPETVSFFPLRTFEILLEGLKRWYDSAVIKAWTGLDEDSRIQRLGFPPSSANVSPLILRLLRGLSPARSIHEISLELSQPSDELLPIVFGLMLAGFIGLEKLSETKVKQETPSKPETHLPEKEDELKKTIETDFDRVSSLDFYEMLKLRPGASDHELSKSYLSISKSYTQENIKTLKNPSLTEKAQKISSWLRLAYETLKDPHLRQIYSRRGRSRLSSGERRLKSVEADRLLFESIRFMEKGSLEKALSLLEEANKKYPEDSTLSGYLGWVLFQKDPKANLERACNLIDEAIDRNPADSQIRYFRGEIHEHLGNWEDAEECFSKALRLQPNFLKAEAAFEHVRSKRIGLQRMTRTKNEP